MKFWVTKDNVTHYSKWPYEYHPSLIPNMKLAMDHLVKKIKNNNKK